MAVSLFVYGTLMSPSVLKILLGRVPTMVQPAVLTGYRRHPVRDQVYPGLVPSPDDESATTTGVLLENIANHELQVLDWFESDDYEKQTVEVAVPPNKEQRQRLLAYIWKRPLEELEVEREWDFSHFEKSHLDWYLANTVRPCREQMDGLGIGKPE